jgi:predicted transcriptional regulator
MTAAIQIPKVTQARIDKLALVAGRSPAAMLRFVLRDGFDAVEQSIRENDIADAQFESGTSHAHDDVMADAQKLLRGALR